MPIPPLDAATGCLPLGRHHCTGQEFQAAFVDAAPFNQSQRRKEIWTHWDETRSALAQLVPVYAAWISGSYVTDKVDPDDMDIVFVIDGGAAETLAATEPGLSQYLVAFGQGKLAHEPAGRRLDTFLVHWKPILSPGPGLTATEQHYYFMRGHWDDFWQRRRTGAKTDPIAVVDTTPRRGFLEVKLGDYPK